MPRSSHLRAIRPSAAVADPQALTSASADAMSAAATAAMAVQSTIVARALPACACARAIQVVERATAHPVILASVVVGTAGRGGGGGVGGETCGLATEGRAGVVSNGSAGSRWAGPADFSPRTTGMRSAAALVVWASMVVAAAAAVAQAAATRGVIRTAQVVAAVVQVAARPRPAAGAVKVVVEASVCLRFTEPML